MSSSRSRGVSVLSDALSESGVAQVESSRSSAPRSRRRRPRSSATHGKPPAARALPRDAHQQLKQLFAEVRVLLFFLLLAARPMSTAGPTGPRCRR